MGKEGQTGWTSDGFCVSFLCCSNKLSQNDTCVCLCMCSVAQSWPTLCDPVNYSPPGSCVHGIPQNSGVGCHFLLQGDLPDLGTEPMYTASQVDSLPLSSVQSVSRVRLFATPQTVAHQASLSITNSQSLLKLISIESVMPFNHLILCHPLLLLAPPKTTQMYYLTVCKARALKSRYQQS